MTPLGIIITSLLVLVALCAPRRWALLAMMAGVLFLTQYVGVNLAGFHLWALRFLEFAGFIRVVARREISFNQLNQIDRTLVLLYSYMTVVFLLRSSIGQANQIGMMLDCFLSYFTFRGLIRDLEDFHWFLKAFIFLLIPYTILVLAESLTGHNQFALLGGVDGGSNWMRHGRPRCFGSFRQPDTLGMFAASFIPLFIGQFFTPSLKKRALFAIGLCLIIAWAANSGGATAAAVFGMAGWGFWRYRTEMRKIRWGMIGMITALALVMKAPVWFIFARASAITGGGGWHRSHLIDQAYQHLDQWWLAGLAHNETIDWFAYKLDVVGGADITNQYIEYGLTAGAGAIVLFILLLTRAFSQLGNALAVVRSNFQRPDENEFMLWGLGVMLVVHCVDWFDIIYFDQMYMVWFMQLAAISSISDSLLRSQFQANQPAELPSETEVLRPASQFQHKLPQE